MKKILLSLLLLTSFLYSDYTVGETNFAIANPPETRNIIGNMKIIGNTVLCPKVNGACVESAPGVTNQELNLNFVNTDGFGGYAPSYRFKTSSRAKLEIPPNAKIVWAGLYAQGLLSFVHSANAAKPFLNEPIILTIPGLGKIAKFADKTNLNDIWRAGTGIFYGSFSLVDELIGKKGSQINGWVTASNVMATEGLESGIGNSGAWVLAVIYEDADETLKNISIFNGYRVVTWGSSVPDTIIGISGFLTPASGPVESSLSIFVGEGDKALAYDSLFLNDKPIGTPGNAFNSSIHGVDQRIPKLENNQGIDIQYHNVSKIIGNSNTSATIKMNSQGDIYYPIFAAFTTELYSPRICYYIDTIIDTSNNETIYDNKTFVKDLKPGGEYQYNVWLANTKSDNSTRPLETAQGVETYMNYLDSTKLEYKNGTTYIKNLNSTKKHISDSGGDDIGEYSDNTSTWRIGVGADAGSGGVLEPAASFNDATSKVFVNFNSVLANNYSEKQIDIDDLLEFKIAFKTDVITIGKDNAQKIPKCVNFDTNASVEQPEPGSFNIVNISFNKNLGDKVSLNATDADNALYTQIVSKMFYGKIIAVDLSGSELSGKGTLTDTLDNTTLKVKLIETPDYNSCPNADCKKDRCENATPLITFNDINFDSHGTGSMNINTTIKLASKKVSFKLSYTNSKGEEKTDCSLDSFSVRPETFSIDGLGTLPKGGKNETVNINALGYNTNSLAQGYNQLKDKIIVPQSNITLLKPSSCDKEYIENEFSHNVKNDFINGTTKADVYYNNIGNISILIQDIDWSLIDYSSDKEDCIKNNGSNTPNSKGKVGCNIEKNLTISFYPTNFLGDFALKNFNNSNFTYLSNNANMAAIIDTNITSVLYDNQTAATNYHKGCWAKDVKYSIDLIKDPIDWAYIKNGISQNATEKVIFSNIDSNRANLTTARNANPASIQSFEKYFVNGTASNLMTGINFNRTVDITQNPFTLNASALNITKIEDADINSTRGTNYSSGEAKFYYGRVFSVDYIGSSPIYATLRYEGYCGTGCNTATYDALLSSDKNPNERNWYINKEHDSLVYGNATHLKQYSIPSNANNNITIDPTHSVNIEGGKESGIKLNHNNPPYADDIIIDTQDWLVYNQRNPNANSNKFNVEFIGEGGGWAGVGNVSDDTIVGRNVTIDASNRTKRKID